MNRRKKSRPWTPENDRFIQDNWKTMTDDEMAARLKRTPGYIGNARRRLGLKRPVGGSRSNKRYWTKKEDEYLCEHWGTVSIPTIAQTLNRSPGAVDVRANRLGLGSFLESGEYVTLNQLLCTVTGSPNNGSYAVKSWVENRGLPVHSKKVNHCSFRIVYLSEFWMWAEQHRSFIDFSRMEPLALGKEPPWVKEQRRKDHHANRLQCKTPWTDEDDSRLRMLLSQQRYTWAEVCSMMNRSHGAIQRRCTTLNIKDRPLSLPLKGKAGSWTEADFKALEDGIRHGDSYAAIGRTVNRSEKCVRSKVYNIYLTENADKVREMMGPGPWGSGAPELDVKHGFYISRTRCQVKKDLNNLCELLLTRAAQLKNVGDYWQRAMCQHWDPIAHCFLGCNNCDTCSAFLRKSEVNRYGT